MSDHPGPQLPPGFEMLGQMWNMMPLASAFQGAAPHALNPSLSMMSDLVAPLTNVEELDKRITDMRAVEQWLKLNLNLLQSAIQALEVQRATLATLKAFGAFAQSSMTAPPPNAPGAAPQPAATPQSAPRPAAASASAADAARFPAPGQPAGAAGLDPAAWWGTLQNQFNQIAGIAMAAAADGAAQVDAAAKQTARASEVAPGAGSKAPGRRPAQAPADPAPKRTARARKPAASREAKPPEKP